MHDLRALVPAGLDQAEDPVELGLGDERAHVRIVDARADPHAGEDVADAAGDLVDERPRHEHAGLRAARLPGVVGDPVRGRGCRRVEVRVVEHDLGGLPAELQRDDRRDPLRGGPEDLAAGGHRAAERQAVDPGVSCEVRAGIRAEPGDHVQDPRRHAGLVGQAGHVRASTRGVSAEGLATIVFPTVRAGATPRAKTSSG